MSNLPYTRTDEELNSNITEVMEKFEEFKAFAKDFGFDIRLFPYSLESLQLYYNDDYPGMVLVDKDELVPSVKWDGDPVHIAINNIQFGAAIKLAKMGCTISRLGWNGKGLKVVYQKGYPDGVPCNAQTAKAWGMKEGELFRCEPYLQISTVDGSHAMWVPSIRDVLAADWSAVGELSATDIDSIMDAMSKDTEFIYAQIKTALNAAKKDAE